MKEKENWTRKRKMKWNDNEKYYDIRKERKKSVVIRVVYCLVKESYPDYNTY